MKKLHPVTWPTLGVVGLAALWSAGWFYAASRSDEVLATVVEQADQRDLRLVCANRTTGGFPFRLEIRCPDAKLSHKKEDAQIQVRQLTAIQQIYDPKHTILDFQSPLVVQADKRVEIQAKQFQASFKEDKSGLTSAVHAKDVVLTVEGAAHPLKIKDILGANRSVLTSGSQVQNEQSFSLVDLKGADESVPLQFRLESITSGSSIDRPQSLAIKMGHLSTPKGAVSLTGEINALDVKPNGEILLDVRDLPDLAENLAKIAGSAPAQARLLAVQVERMIPSSSKTDQGSRFKLDIREGAVFWNGLRLTDLQSSPR